MRAILAVILGIVALIALSLVVVAATSMVLRWRRSNPEQPAKDALITGVVFGVIFLVTSCGALVSLPSAAPEEAAQEESPSVEPTEPVLEATIPEPVAEEEAREAPDPPPDPEDTAIPGLLPVDVYASLEDRGFSCGGPEPIGDAGEVWWVCEGSDLSADYVVEVWGPDGSSVRLVEATAISLDSSPVDESLLAFVATVPYHGSNPEEAKLWIEESIDAGRASTEIGGVSYELAGPPTGRILTIKVPGTSG